MVRLRSIGWALLLAGCGGGGGGGGSDGGAGGGGGEGGGTGGALPALDTLSASDCRSYLPLTTDGVWRYRPKDAADGDDTVAEVHLRESDADKEYIRETTAVFQASIGGMDKQIRQVLDETLVVDLGTVGDVGPHVGFKDLQIEEREVGTRKFVRTLDHKFLPPYQFIADAWHTGQFDNLWSNDQTRLTEDVQHAGDEEAQHQSYIVPEVRVETSADEKILFVQGKYREHVRKIDVYDDQSGTLRRSYWVQPGVGVVEFQFADTGNIDFVLTETNLEPDGNPHPSCPAPMSAGQ
jgi:hypothetical protein